MFRTAERMAGRCTDHFVTVAQAMTEMSLRAGIQKAGNYTRIFSGFDLDPFLAAKRDEAFRRELGFAPDDFVIGKLARLTRLKGHDDLLEAAPEILQRIPSARFLLIGDGNWWGRLRRKAADLGVAESVVFRGLIPPSAVPSHLAQCDVLVHLSRREGLPRSLPQAMSVGLPVVAYDCDGAREVCLERETGFLLPAGDVKGLGDRLVELADNPELCVRFGRSGRNLVRRNFSVELMVDQLAGLYERLWKERNGMSPAAR